MDWATGFEEANWKSHFELLLHVKNTTSLA